MKHTWVAQSLTDLPNIARQIQAITEPRRKFALTGDMGVGKTTFIKEFAALLQVTDRVSSPTYGIINEYASLRAEPVYHIDLYRLHTLDEALAIHIEAYLYDNAYCFIEWPQLVAPLLPPDTVYLELSLLPMDIER